MNKLLVKTSSIMSTIPNKNSPRLTPSPEENSLSLTQNEKNYRQQRQHPHDLQRGALSGIGTTGKRTKPGNSGTSSLLLPGENAVEQLLLLILRQTHLLDGRQQLLRGGHLEILGDVPRTDGYPVLNALQKVRHVFPHFPPKESKPRGYLPITLNYQTDTSHLAPRLLTPNHQNARLS